MSIMRTSIQALVLITTVLLPGISYANDIAVSVYTNKQSNTVYLQQPLRLSQFLEQQSLAYTGQQQNHLNYSRSKLGNQALQLQIEQMRSDVLDELTELVAYYQKAGAVDYSVAAREIRQQLQSADLFAAYFLSIEPDKLRIDTNKNVLLTPAESPYKLLLPTGPVNPKRFGVSESNPAVDNAYRWRIGTNGDVAREPIALYNADEISRCYAHDFGNPLTLGQYERCTVSETASEQTAAFNTYVGINPEVIPQRYKGLNERIVTLLKFVVENYDN